VNNKIKKYWVSILSLGVLVILISAAYVLKDKETLPKTSHIFNYIVNPLFSGHSYTTSEPVHLFIGEHNFWIPKYYIDSISNSESGNNEGVLLFANLPDFSPRINEKRNKNIPSKNLSYFVSIHIQDKALFTESFQEMYNLRRTYQPSLKFQKNIYNLIFEIPTEAKSPIFNKELYTENNDTGVISYLECDRDRSGKKPSCTHHFKYLDLFIDVSYRKDWLPKWRKIQKDTIEFIDAFQKQPVTEDNVGDPI
jgi:hypothetical protein